MAEAKVKILMDLEDQVSGKMDKIKDSLGGFQDGVEKMKPAFEKMAAVGAGGLLAIGGALTVATSSFGEAERAQRQLEHAVIDVSKGTKEQAEAISKLSDVMQAKSGIDGDALKMGAAQLSTFGLLPASVVKLTKSLADLTVNQNGVNASSDAYVQSANSIAKALNGQFGVLEKSGIRFTDAQQKIILYGKESEKVAAITEGLAQNLRETTDTINGVDKANARMNRSLGEIMESLGKTFAPLLEEISNKIVPFLQGLQEWIENNPKLTITLVEVAAAVFGLLTITGTLGILFASLMSTLTALTAVAAAFGISAIALVGIFALIPLAIAAIIAIGVLLYQHWDQVKAFAIQVWTAIANAVTVALAAIGNVVTGAISAVGGAFTIGMNAIAAAATAVWQVITDIFKFAVALIVGIVIETFALFGIDIVAVFQTIKDFFVQFWADLTVAFQFAVDGLKAIWSAVWGVIRDVVPPVWNSIKNAVGGALNWIVAKFREITEPLSAAWGTLWTGMTSAVTTAWEGVKSTIKASLNWIIEKINAIIDSINSVASKGAGALGFTAPQIGRIPALADGGIVNRPTLALVGEAGPEAVIPLSRGLAGAGGFGGLNLYMSGNTFYGEEGVAERIGRDVMKMIRANIRL